ncbi:MAG: RadC family protein [Candidatus Omnitrophota bacterium]
MNDRNTKGLQVREWPADERPREKLLARGEQALSNAELLAILLRTGSRGEDVVALARRILHACGGWGGLLRAEKGAWGGFRGLGPAKIAQIRAALEIGRRFRYQEARQRKEKIRSAADAARLLSPLMRERPVESFWMMCLDSDHRVIDIREECRGTVNFAEPILREIMRRAIQGFAAAVICAHNHPSGRPDPSPQDRAFTRRLVQAGECLQVKVLDHLIITDQTYYSFADQGVLN